MHCLHTPHCISTACLQVLENLLLSHRLRVGRFPGPMYLACCEPGQARADTTVLVAMSIRGFPNLTYSEPGQACADVARGWGHACQRLYPSCAQEDVIIAL